MRRGLSPGIQGDEVLALDFTGRSLASRLSDRSGNSHDATIVGSEGDLSWWTGPFGGGFNTSAAGSYLTVADHADFDLADDIAVEAWFWRDEDDATLRNIVNRTETANTWRLYVGADMKLALQVFDSSGASNYTIAGPTLQARRWYHALGHFDSSGVLRLYLDGYLVAVEDAGFVALRTTGTGLVRIGGGATAGSSWVGSIAHVRIREVSSVDASLLSPRLSPRNQTQRSQWYGFHWDRRLELAGKTWTTDSGAFYLGEADIVTAADIAGDAGWGEDLLSVKAYSSAGGAATSYTRNATVAEVQAGSDVWTWDEANRRLYVSEDPSGLANLVVEVRSWWGERGSVHPGGRWTRPAVVGVTPPSRKAPALMAPLELGGGGRVALAIQHPDLAVDSLSFEGAGLSLVRTAVTLYSVRREGGWGQARKLLVGDVESTQGSSPDVLELSLRSDVSRLFVLPLTATRVDHLTYGDAHPTAYDHTFPELWGGPLLDIIAVCVDMTAAAWAGGYAYALRRYKVAARNITYIGNVRKSDGAEVWITNVDLDAGTFDVRATSVDGSPLTCTVWGFGTPSSPTTSDFVTEFGSTADCDTSPLAMLNGMLSEWAGLSSVTDNGSTSSRVAVLRRLAEVLNGAAATQEEIERLLHETLTTLFSPRTGGLTWSDLNKADSSSRTLRDEDLIRGGFGPVDHASLAKKLKGSAWEYSDDEGVARLGKVVEVATDALETQGQERVWTPPRGEQTRFQAAGSLQTWLGQLVTRYSDPDAGRAYFATVPPRVDVELWDVVTLAGSDLPSGQTARTRVTSIREMRDRVELELHPEAPWPTDGTSAESQRLGIGPSCLIQFEDAGGFDFTPAGSWAQVGTFKQTLAGCGEWPDDLSELFVAYASATGGTLELRLVDAETLNVIATITGIGAETLYSQTAFANQPTAQSDIILEGQSTDGATSASVFDASWFAVEGTPLSTSPYLPLVFHAAGSSSPTTLPALGRKERQGWIPVLRWGSATGETETGTGYVNAIADDAGGVFGDFIPTARAGLKLVIYAKCVGGTGTVRLRNVTSGATIAEIGSITSEAFYEDASVSSPVDAEDEYEIQGKVTAGTLTVYAALVYAAPTGPPRPATAHRPAYWWDGTITDDAPLPNLLASWFSEAGVAPTSTKYIAGVPHMMFVGGTGSTGWSQTFFAVGFVIGSMGGASSVTFTAFNWRPYSPASPLVNNSKTVTSAGAYMMVAPLLWDSSLQTLNYYLTFTSGAPTVKAIYVLAMPTDDLQTYWTLPDSTHVLLPPYADLGASVRTFGASVALGTATDLDVAVDTYYGYPIALIGDIASSGHHEVGSGWATWVYPSYRDGDASSTVKGDVIWYRPEDD